MLEPVGRLTPGTVVNGRVERSGEADRYRLTRWVEKNDHAKVDAVELYDEQTDPQENVNIAADPKNAELVASLTEQWRKGWKGAKK